jgi:hypothetical protein
MPHILSSGLTCEYEESAFAASWVIAESGKPVRRVDRVVRQNDQSMICWMGQVTWPAQARIPQPVVGGAG